jgi:osmotically-inducible protein OsmY
MKFSLYVMPLCAGLALIGCSNNRKAPDVAGNIHRSIEQAGIRNVSVEQDRTNGIVTLAGRVPDNSEKARADSIAQSMAQGEVVANKIEVAPNGQENVVKSVDAKLDKAISANLDALLIQNGWDKAIRHTEKNGVVTLSGNVDSQQLRADVERAAASIPNVQQVINTLQVKDQKASSTR